MSDKKEKQEKPLPTRNRVLPNSNIVEMQVLGALMADPEAADEFLGSISKEFFYSTRNKTIFDEIHKRLMSGLPFDSTSLISGMTEDVKEKIGGFSYLLEVADSAISSATLEQDIGQLQKYAQLRNIITIADTINEKAFNNEDADAVVTYAQNSIYSVTTNSIKKELRPVFETADDVINNISEIFNDPTKKTKGLETGFKFLDRMSNGGFLPGQMIVLAARPGYGKTSFAMNIAANVVRNDSNKVVAVFNLEMAAEELVKRLLATYTGIDGKKIGAITALTGEEYTTLVKSKKQFANSKMFIDDSSGVSASDIFLRSRRLKAKEGRLDLIIIDHMQLIGGDSRRGRYELMTEISRMVKIMAKELEVPVIVLSQTSRDIEKGDGSNDGKEREPRMSDLRESGAIEQDADMIIFLGKGDFALSVEDDNRIGVTAKVLKNRSGEIGDLYYEWQKNLMTFYEVEHVEMLNKAEDKVEEQKKESSKPKAADEVMSQFEEFSDDDIPPEDQISGFPSDLMNELQGFAGDGPKLNPEDMI